MNVIYSLQDKGLPSGSSMAFAEVQGMFYDSQIKCAVMPCADGSTLIKQMSVDYFASHLKEFFAAGTKDGVVFIAITSMGAFLRVPPGTDYAAFRMSHSDLFKETTPVWDVPEPTLTAGPPVSGMKLH